MKEELKQIQFGDGRYAVSNTGEVYNTFTGRKLKQSTINKNYKQVSLYPHTGDRKNLLVHRLVAIAFIDNPLNLPFINHIDNNPSNNHVSNLEWCTASYNTQYSYDTGRQPLTGNDHGYSKLDQYQVTVIRTLFKDLTVRQIAEYFKVSTSTIHSIRTFKTWISPL